MRLSRHSEVALRTLVYLTAHPGRLTPIGEIARSLNVSHNHLMKIVPKLRKGGFVEVARGRAGGVRLARDPKDIRIAEVIRRMERSLNVPHCECPGFVAPLIGAIQAATVAYLTSLDGYTLADLATRGHQSGGEKSHIDDNVEWP